MSRPRCALDAADFVERVDPPVVSPNGDLAVFWVTPTTAPQDERTAQLLERLRDEVLSHAVGDEGRDDGHRLDGLRGRHLFGVGLGVAVLLDVTLVGWCWSAQR